MERTEWAARDGRCAALRGATRRSATSSTSDQVVLVALRQARPHGADGMGRPGWSLRRSTRRYSSQRDEFYLRPGSACRAATSPSARSGRNGPPGMVVAPLYAALLVAARRVLPPTR